MGLVSALLTIETAINASLGKSVFANAVSTLRDLPTAEQLRDAIAAKASLVSVSSVRVTDATESAPSTIAELASAACPLTATLSSPTTLTFAIAGAMVAGINVHVAAPNVDAYHQTTAAETPATIASAIAAQLPARAQPSAAGPSLTIAGCPFTYSIFAANSAQLVIEEGRSSALIQVTVWAPGSETRYALRDVLSVAVGTVRTRSFMMPDGSELLIDRANQTFDDRGQENAGVYTASLFFDCIFSDTTLDAATPVGAVDVNVQIGGAPIPFAIA